MVGFYNLSKGAGAKGADGVNLAKTFVRFQLCYMLTLWLNVFKINKSGPTKYLERMRLFLAITPIASNCVVDDI